jgi:hypothetical protein
LACGLSLLETPDFIVSVSIIERVRLPYTVTAQNSLAGTLAGTCRRYILPPSSHRPLLSLAALMYCEPAPTIGLIMPAATVMASKV